MKREPKKMKKTCSRTDNPNAELAKQFSELGDFEKAKRDGFFKYNAYRKAARVIMDYPEKIVSGKSAQKNMNGIGKQISIKIDQYLKTGIIAKLEKERKGKEEIGGFRSRGGNFIECS